ncbi:transposase [Patescibacteria group bacterium]|nr:transposase [Patescibacteria group bacterium]
MCFSLNVKHIVTAKNNLTNNAGGKAFLKEVVPENDPTCGNVIAIQTFGDLLGYNPHCQILVRDGCFSGNGMFIKKSYLIEKVGLAMRDELLKVTTSDA